MTVVAGQLAWLVRRSVLRTLRRPTSVIPSTLFPLVLLAVFTEGLRPLTRVPGFPADSYLDFALAGAIVQAVMVGGINIGTDLAVDVQSGFLDRLSLTPVGRWPLLLGQVSGALLLALAQALLYLGLGLAFGVRIEAGLGGVVVALGLTVVISLAFSTIGANLALRTGSGEALQGAFPLFFVILTFSSFFLPRALIEVRWFRVVATANPSSYLIEGIRNLVITGWDTRALVLAFGLSAAISAIAMAGASSALNKRLGPR